MHINNNCRRGVERQCDIIATATSPDTTCTFIEMMKKWLMYIAVIYFNWFLVLWWINWEKKVYSAKKYLARYVVSLVIHSRYLVIFFLSRSPKMACNFVLKSLYCLKIRQIYSFWSSELYFKKSRNNGFLYFETSSIILTIIS